jgi:metal-dependent amidase/aminoacylase/carboxypeptidase family protein
MPQATVDQVVLAAMIVIRLQTVISRETAPGETAVLTVGSIAAGTKSNVISDHAELQLNIRTYSDATRTAVLCQASGSPKDPEFELFDRFPLTDNDPDTTARVATAFAAHFGDRSTTMPMGTASEDFSDIPNALGVLYTYWGIGASTPTRTAKPSKPAECPTTFPSTTRPPSPRSSNPRSTPEPRHSWWPHSRRCDEGGSKRRFHSINADRLDAFEMIDDNGKSSLWRRCR